MNSLRTWLWLCTLAGGCAATEVRDAEDPVRPGKADPNPDRANMEDAAFVSSEQVCRGDGFACCDGACAPDTTIENMCASNEDFVVSFRRGADDCFSVSFVFGYSNSTGYAYTASGELRSCTMRGDGHGARVGGDVDFCLVDADDGCIVCAVDGPGVELEGWLETMPWCDESDDLPFSLEGIDRGDIGDSPAMPGDDP